MTDSDRFLILSMGYSEALNLSESPTSLTGVKREACRSPAPPPAKRRTPRPASRPASPRAELHSPPQLRHSRRDATSPPQTNGMPNTNGVNGAAFKITTRGEDLQCCVVLRFISTKVLEPNVLSSTCLVNSSYNFCFC